METKLTFAKGWCKVWTFLASLFQDKLEGTSTKRVIIIGTFIMFCRIINANLVDPTKIVDDNILYAVGIVILGGIGMTIPEWFSPKVKNQNTTPIPPTL